METQLKTIGDYLSILPAEHRDKVIQDYMNYLDEENPLDDGDEIAEKLNEHLNQPCGSLATAVYFTKEESDDEEEFQFWYKIINQYSTNPI